MRKRGLRKTLYIISGYSILVVLFFAVIGFLIWLLGFKLFCLIATVIAVMVELEPTQYSKLLVEMATETNRFTTLSLLQCFLMVTTN